ncbi:exodeoxyribonuclease V subunit gamma [Catenovulum adriaticum]|uniref:RecBCD enzyme subunit RecC n=1 Tax=Catenovulum adriaticum TaxID=2984846 RepID=A0ABY7ASG8_9ALTE|nr:exodeoxyribonuclease V subunit gamma [Catenovulum sp. TS8]WAJ71455.1 exodeoxyribonuclease V subunit gamma [Catenovulum sp. TS8]
MFIVYPSNRLEDLIILLEKVLATRQASVFEQDEILVESQGMQHWINMQLAASQGVAMNIDFPMPSRFIWNLARQILGDDLIPRKSPYSREILAFRIEHILTQSEFINSSFSDEVNQYWQTAQHSKQLRRFQLASKLADVFEQYMLYRPEWLDTWQAHRQPDELSTDSLLNTASWQAEIWRSLVDKAPYHQANLQDLAISQLPNHLDKLPKQIYIFGINALPPKSLSFFEAISQHIPVHLFHLNPSVEFWGDIQTDKIKAKRDKLQQNINWDNDQTELSNPILANLGGQGRAFFNSLQQLDTFEISAYSDLDTLDSDVDKRSVLQQIQADILTLQDARHEALTTEPAEPRVDDSIVVSASHSALREIQVLHDYLLHQFKQNPSLQPQDIVVMCPAIEDYAPYIEAVFKRPIEYGADNEIKLPCSIADRNSLDAEPLINSFTDLLNLPDSRFEVSKILDYIRLPALQAQFGFSESELSTIEYWLSEAAVHWGIDESHKAKMSHLNSADATFTWQWGLDRLIYGFAWGDEAHIENEQLWLPHVEGNNAILLGRLCFLLERLQYHAKSLTLNRTPAEWHQYLHELKTQFFAENDQEQDAFFIIDNAINALTERCEKAEFNESLDLSTVRYFLTQLFSQPDASNHFLTGQITFCSMVPMRSIPFKVIAILGLNDGQYPRQQNPISFDLMASTQAKLGDRSRRGDDRYLFLEALISARNSLYLSYQGRDIRNNEARQPSLILKELMDYLSQAYGWQFVLDTALLPENNQLKVNPLHAFSEQAYRGKWPSFDKNWCRLIYPKNNNHQPSDSQAHTYLSATHAEDTLIEVDIEELVRFFADPLAYFARQQLNLNLSDYQLNLEDVEPFSVNVLDEYLLRQSFCQQMLTSAVPRPHTEVTENLLNPLARQVSLSGRLPESPLKQQVIENSQALSELMVEKLGFNTLLNQHIKLEVNGYLLSTQICLAGPANESEYNPEANYNVVSASDTHPKSLNRPEPNIVVWRAAVRKAKDDIRLWLNHLMACIYFNQGESPLSQVNSTGVFLNSKKDGVSQVRLSLEMDSEQAKEHLTQLIKMWQQGVKTPSLYYADLAKVYLGKTLNKKQKPQVNELSSNPEQIILWEKFQTEILMNNEYYQWFFPVEQAFDSNNHETLIKAFYPLYDALQDVK